MTNSDLETEVTTTHKKDKVSAFKKITLREGRSRSQQNISNIIPESCY